MIDKAETKVLSLSNSLNPHHMAPIGLSIQFRCQIIYCKIWLIDQADYVNMRHKVTNFNWNASVNSDINVYATNVISVINNLASDCIPN